MAKVQPYQIDAVLKLVLEVSPERDVQLSLLTAALVLLCRNYDIRRSSLIEHVKKLFGRPAEVVTPAHGPSITGRNDNAQDSVEAS